MVDKIIRYFPLWIPVIVIWIAWSLSNNKTEHQDTPVLSKCDSLIMANDSLSRRLEVANRRMQQYRIGLWFLRDKNRQAYDYVINAGNLNFQNEWQ